jgi:outer membrane protein OmpA-like peptidoglycan-associated protein
VPRTPMAAGGLALAMGLLVAVPTVATVAEPAAASESSGPESFAHPDQATIDDSITDLDPKTTDLKRNVVDAQTKKTEGDSTVVTLNTDILFDFDSAKLSEKAKDNIAEVVPDLPTDSTITVAGYTDSKGSDAYNTKLSEKRAKAVAEVLTSKKPGLTVKAKGYGEKDPVASNGSAEKDNPQGRAKNRRVEITFD